MQNDNYSRQAQKLNLQHLINNTHLPQNVVPLGESKRMNFEISAELANLRNEFKNFKNTIRTKISSDLGDSDDQSIGNSIDKQNARSNLTENKSDFHSGYQTGKFEDLYNTGSFSTGNKTATPPSITKTEPILAVQEYETDYKKSPSVSRQNTSIPDMSRFDEDISDYDRSIYWNPETDNAQSTLLDVKSIFENKPFVVMSKPNDIGEKRGDGDILSSTISDCSSFSNTKRREEKNIMQKFEEETIKAKQQMNGLMEFKGEVAKLMRGLGRSPMKSPDKQMTTQVAKDPFENKKIKYREVDVYPQEPVVEPQIQLPGQVQERSSIPSVQENLHDSGELNDLFRRRIHNSIAQSDSSDDIYMKKKQELENMNNRLLETDEPTDDEYGSNNEVPMFKKTLSIIFSTNESVESSNISRNCSRKSLIHNLDDSLPAERTAVRKKGSLQDSEFDPHDIKENVMEGKMPSRQPSAKTLEGTNKWTNSLTSNHSSKNEDDNVLSLVQLIMFQNQGNRDLGEKLNRLMDLYSNHVEKQDVKINDLKQKNEKLNQTNELLIKTLKTCEKEVDNLAQTNSNLHKNLVYLQSELNKRENIEDIKKLAQSQREQRRQQRIELDKKCTELDETQRKFSVSEAKVLGLTAYTKSCEDSICAINVTLQKLILKSNMKAATPALYKVLSSIVDETSKFVDKLDTSCEADISKPMNSKPSSYFESGSDSSISFERDSHPYPRISPSKILQEHKKGSNNVLQSTMSPLSSNTLKSNSSAVSIVKSYDNVERKESSGRSTSAMGKRERGRERDKENVKENPTSYSNKNSRKEKSAPNLRSTSPNFNQIAPQPAQKINSELDDKIKDNLRKRLMNNLKVGQKK